MLILFKESCSVKTESFLGFIAELLDLDSINEDLLTAEGVLDSIKKITLISMIESEFGAEMLEDEIMVASTINDIIIFLKKKNVLEN